jgi:hypothetical protein
MADKETTSTREYIRGYEDARHARGYDDGSSAFVKILTVGLTGEGPDEQAYAEGWRDGKADRNR